MYAARVLQLLDVTRVPYAYRTVLATYYATVPTGAAARGRDELRAAAPTGPCVCPKTK